LCSDAVGSGTQHGVGVVPFSGGFYDGLPQPAAVWCGVLRRTFKFVPVARWTQEDSGRGLAGAGDNRRGTCLFQEFAVPSWTGSQFAG